MDSQSDNQSPVTPQQTPQPLSQQPPASATKKSKKLWIIAGVVVLALLVISSVVRMFSGGPNTANTGGDSNKLFTDMLSAAAQKTKVQQLTTFKLWSEGVDTATPPQDDQLSFSEFDAATKKFNTINAAVTSRGAAEAEKCLDGKPHRYLIEGKTLAALVEGLNSPSTREGAYTDPNGPYSPCNVERSRRVGKFSDGVIPVGMTADQVKSWLGYFKARNLFTVKDEGKTEYKGKQVRKLSFTVNPERGNMGLFYAVRDGDTSQTNGLNFNWEENFGMQIGADLANPPSMTGYYLVDEQTKLPVFSEFTSAVPQGKQPAEVPSFKQKAEYTYPSQLTITNDTKLTILE